MSIPGDASPLLLGGGAQQYKIERSLRFNSSDSAYLSRTPASAGNRKTWTWSGWVKRVSNVPKTFIGAGTLETDEANFGFGTDGCFEYYDRTSGTTLDIYRISTAVFRDFSAWYHVVVALDTTSSSADDRIKVYINGTQLTSFSSLINPPQNYESQFNTTTQHAIGRRNFGGTYFEGYLADIHFIDGQALTPSSFAETNITTGQWVPKAFSGGSYGTNGFRLAFADNSNNTATTLGKDSSGNGNNWTPNNLSVTAGAGNDSLVDTPTSYGTDTGAGGEVRGNYCTLNPLAAGSNAVLANGNLDYSTSSSSNALAIATIGISSGKWYWESVMTGSYSVIGAYQSGPLNTTYLGASGVTFGFTNGNSQVQSGVSAPTGSLSFVAGDVIGFALNLDAGTCVVYKNNVASLTYSGLTGTWFPATGANAAAACTFNFGQRPFAYTAPSGFKPLCDTNLPAPVVAKPNTAFDVKLYTGNGSTQTISGLGFSPDLVWIKSRSAAYNNRLYDQVRGVENVLNSNTTAAEVSDGTGLTAFTSSGFTLGSSLAQNENSSTFVAWTWDAGSSTVTNTQGSITTSVRANVSAGFSIVTYTGNGSNATVGHGLGVAPSFIIVKKRSSSENWLVWFKGFSSNEYLYLNATNAKSSFSGTWGSLPTSSLFGVFDQSVNASGQTFVAYCFAPVAGYSSFGSYTGNGSTDGPFIYTGFRPRWILVKRTDGVIQWTILDTARSASNVADQRLFPNLSQAETVNGDGNTDLLSNGFKPRNIDSAFNASGGTYIYAAFAENPFQYARAR